MRAAATQRVWRRVARTTSCDDPGVGAFVRDRCAPAFVHMVNHPPPNATARQHRSRRKRFQPPPTGAVARESANPQRSRIATGGARRGRGRRFTVSGMRRVSRATTARREGIESMRATTAVPRRQQRFNIVGGVQANCPVAMQFRLATEQRPASGSHTAVQSDDPRSVPVRWGSVRWWRRRGYNARRPTSRTGRRGSDHRPPPSVHARPRTRNACRQVINRVPALGRRHQASAVRRSGWSAVGRPACATVPAGTAGPDPGRHDVVPASVEQ